MDEGRQSMDERIQCHLINYVNANVIKYRPLYMPAMAVVSDKMDS